jgi:endonuclease/exonuclease/phosphatase family metal-dependent hydrolase
MTTRIMTYNVHSCVGVDKRLDVARVAAVIAQSKPDIVALQELDVCRNRTGGIDQAHAIASRLGMAFHFNCAMRVEEEQYGDAILTALPVRLVRSGRLPTLPRVRGLEPRGALWVAVEVEPGVELQVINTHLGLVPLEQRGQAAALLGRDWLGHPDCRDPTILIGDFNATSRYAAYKVLADRLKDGQRELVRTGRRARTLRTFPSRFPVLRIDHLFVSPGVEMLDVHAPGGPLPRAASDHLPLVADLKVTAR